MISEYANPPALDIYIQLSLFNILRFPLVVLPKALKAVSEAYNATNNLEKFLAEPAAPKQDLEGQPAVHFNKVRSYSPASIAVKLVGCMFHLGGKTRYVIV